MLIFSLLVVVVFNFTFDPGSTYALEAAPGIIWVAFTFSGIIGLNRSFVYEVDKGCIHGLLLAPLDRGDIYFGKMIGNLIFMSFVEFLTVPLFLILFDLQLEQVFFQFMLIIILATIGFSAVGTLFSAISVNTKTREMMLPILFLPIIAPVLVSAVGATSSLLNQQGGNEIATGVTFLVLFDLIFISSGYLTFEFVMEE